MKLKGISTIERHIEKLVLLVFSLVLAFVLVQQLELLPGSETTIKVGAQDVPIDQAPLAVRDVAQAKLAQLNSDRLDERIPPSLDNPAELFVQKLRQPTPTLRLASLAQPQVTIGGTYASGGESPSVPMGQVVFAQVSPPAPSAPLTRVHGCAIDPLAAAEIGPELLAMLPPSQPYDVRAVSVETRFDAEQFRQMLASPGEGLQPVPPNFWQGRSEILDVEFVRQELGSDGQWSDETLLNPLPGRFSMRESLNASDVEPSKLREILTNERAQRGAIRRPDFYSFVSGESWLWPSYGIVEARDPADQDRIDLLVRQVRDVRDDVQRVLDQIAKLKGGGKSDNAPDQNDPRSDRGQDDENEYHWPSIPRTWRAQFGGGGGGPAPTTPTRDRDAERLKALEARLELLRKQEQSLLEELKTFGVDGEGKLLDAAEQSKFTEPLDSLSQPSSLRVTLWTHDLAVIPGKTYRYRSRVTLTNPFFGQEAQLPADQRSLAQGLTIMSEFSPWSEPVFVEPKVVYFVRNASPADNAAFNVEARASVDLFEFYFGYWRRASANVNPGDAFSAIVDLPELKTWEITRDDSGAPFVGEATELEKSRRIMSDVFLLDVAGLPGGGPQQRVSEVYLGLDGGSRIAMRTVESGAIDKDPIYALLRDSADKGKQAILREPGSALAQGKTPPASDSGFPADDQPLPTDEKPDNSTPGGLPTAPEPF